MALPRRRFLQLSSFAAAFLAGGRSWARATSPTVTADGPIVLSTWDNGIPANVAAWDVLSRGGRALDAVEAGVRVPEADPKVQSVGYGGLPDRDGRVTLDACIMDERAGCGSVAVEGRVGQACRARWSALE